REWLIARGYQLKEKGGNVSSLPIANAEEMIPFQKGQIDGAWVPEPWATRLVQELGGKRFLDERPLWQDRQFCTALVVVRKAFLDANPGMVKKFIATHVEITQWIKANPDQAKKLVNSEIGREVG